MPNNPPCPNCGKSSEVHEATDATFWMRTKHWSCDNCEGFTFTLAESLAAWEEERDAGKT